VAGNYQVGIAQHRRLLSPEARGLDDQISTPGARYQADYDTSDPRLSTLQASGRSLAHQTENPVKDDCIV